MVALGEGVEQVGALEDEMELEVYRHQGMEAPRSTILLTEGQERSEMRLGSGDSREPAGEGRRRSSSKAGNIGGVSFLLARLLSKES